MVVAASQAISDQSWLGVRWCVLGAGGQIGSVAVRRLTEAPESTQIEVFALTRNELDITDERAIMTVLRDISPDFVLNAAAYTDVDGAETDRESATALNTKAPRAIAETCSSLGAKLIHISTDYVFDGSSTRPYSEVDQAEPISFYGESKLHGEIAVIEANPQAWVVRTSWIYAPRFANFPTAILRRLGKGERFEVVDDQIGAPTAADDFVTGILDLTNQSAPYGLYHLVNQGQTTWFEFAREIAQATGFDPDLVIATSSKDSNRAAERPRFSVLSTQKWVASGLAPLAGWQQAWQSQAPEFLGDLTP